LNLGQNDILGEIPVVIGERRNDGRYLMTNLREFVRLLNSDVSNRYRHRLDLRAIKTFYRKHFDYIMKSKDLLWISANTPVDVSWNFLALQETINEYVKAEDNRLLTKAFQTMQSDPLAFIRKLNEIQH
jgi:hypothetical protein